MTRKMPIYINGVCDVCKRTAQNAAFESDDETFADLKSGFRSAGWKIYGETLTCPKCLNLYLSDKEGKNE